MELTEVGRTGRAHGTAGELALRVDEIYEDDVIASDVLLIGDPPVPYFVEHIRTGGKLLARLEKFTTREAVTLLAHKPLFLPTERITAEPTEATTPWDDLLGFTIVAEGYPRLGPIASIVDLPQHYLAEIVHEDRELLVPLHEDLVIAVEEEEQVVRMQLPEGLLELGR